jgi:hypothetical protein
MCAEEARLALKCPNPECGKVFPMTVSWLKANKRFVCSYCNLAFAIDLEKIPGAKFYLDNPRES